MRASYDDGRASVRTFIDMDAHEWRVRRARAWLAFERDDGERRLLTIAPVGWELLSDDALRRALGASRLVTGEPGARPTLTLADGRRARPPISVGRGLERRVSPRRPRA